LNGAGTGHSAQFGSAHAAGVWRSQTDVLVQVEVLKAVQPLLTAHV
jgi:hypothetical protein